MENKTIRNQARLFKALSCEWRLGMVLLLYDRDRSVNEIITGLKKQFRRFNIDRTSVSKHLTVLKRMSIVSCMGAGQKRIYHLDARCLVNAVNCTVELSETSVCSVSGKTL